MSALSLCIDVAGDAFDSQQRKAALHRAPVTVELNELGALIGEGAQRARALGCKADDL